MTAVLTPALARLRSGFDDAFPGRDHTTDGWIGDAAHQTSVSGHNPDDTDGVRAEYSDADTKQEVRAIDVDKDLNWPGATMYDVIRKVLATPADLARLRYIIFCPPAGPFGANVSTIWSRANGWTPARYTGSNPHDKHAHFSGDPATDEDNRPWSVETMGTNDMLTTAQDAMLKDIASRVKYIDGRVEALEGGRVTIGAQFPTHDAPMWLVGAVTALRADVAELKARPAAQLTDAQVDQLAARIVAADNPLGDADKPAIVAAVKQALAEGVI